VVSFTFGPPFRRDEEKPGQTKSVSGRQSCYAQDGEQKFHAPYYKENLVTHPVIRRSNEVTILHLETN